VLGADTHPAQKRPERRPPIRHELRRATAGASGVRFGIRAYGHRYAETHRVKAGITGWAQVNGLRGKISVADRAEWDNYYIDNWSLWLDVKIMLLTVVCRPSTDERRMSLTKADRSAVPAFSRRDGMAPRRLHRYPWPRRRRPQRAPRLTFW